MVGHHCSKERIAARKYPVTMNNCVEPKRGQNGLAKWTAYQISRIDIVSGREENADGEQNFHGGRDEDERTRAIVDRDMRIFIAETGESNVTSHPGLSGVSFNRVGLPYGRSGRAYHRV